MSIRTLPLLAALALAACSSNDKPAPAEAAQTGAVVEKKDAEKAAAPVGRPDESGQVLIRATADDFIPSRVEVKGGEKVTLVFLREVERSCMSKVVFPTLDIEKDLPLGETVEIEVTPEAGGTIPFECPMGHGKSSIKGT